MKRIYTITMMAVVLLFAMSFTAKHAVAKSDVIAPNRYKFEQFSTGCQMAPTRNRDGAVNVKCEYIAMVIIDTKTKKRDAGYLQKGSVITKSKCPLPDAYGRTHCTWSKSSQKDYETALKLLYKDSNINNKTPQVNILQAFKAIVGEYDPHSPSAKIPNMYIPILEDSSIDYSNSPFAK